MRSLLPDAENASLLLVPPVDFLELGGEDVDLVEAGDLIAVEEVEAVVLLCCRQLLRSLHLRGRPIQVHCVVQRLEPLWRTQVDLRHFQPRDDVLPDEELEGEGEEGE